MRFRYSMYLENSKQMNYKKPVDGAFTIHGKRLQHYHVRDLQRELDETFRIHGLFHYMEMRSLSPGGDSIRRFGFVVVNTDTMSSIEFEDGFNSSTRRGKPLNGLHLLQYRGDDAILSHWAERHSELLNKKHRKYNYTDDE